MPSCYLGVSMHLESPATGQLKRRRAIDPGANAESVSKLHVAAACFLCGPHNVNIKIPPPVAKPLFNFPDEIGPAAA